MDVETELRAPCLLIAVPQLADPNFRETVVFVIEHGDAGTMGFIINRHADLTINAFFEGQDMTLARPIEGNAHEGGPVQKNRAFLVHDGDHEGPETEEIEPGMRLSYSLESLEALSQEPPKKLKVFIGYSGWGPNQLNDELSTGAWLVCPASRELVFDTPVEEIWRKALGVLGVDPALLMHSEAVH